MNYLNLLKWFLQFHRLTSPYSSSQKCFNHIKFSLMVAISAYAVISFIFILSIPGFHRNVYFESLFKLMESSSVVFILVELLFRKQELVNIIQFLEEPFHQFGPAFSDQEVIDEFTFALKVLIFIYNSAGLVFLSTRIGSPLIYILLNYSQTELMDLPLPIGYMPIKTDSYVVFSLLFFMGTLVLIVQGLVFANWGLAFAFGSLKIITQLKILNLSLLKFNDRIVHRYMVISELTHSGGRRFNEDIYEKCAFECITESIRVHQSILRQREILEKRFTRTTFIFSQAFTFHLAVQAIQLSTMNQFPNGSTLLETILNAYLSVGQLIALSYCGQKIIDESGKLHFAVYDCPWLDKPKSFKRIIVIMMEVATRPLRLTACGLYALEMQLLHNIACAAYSFFNVMLSVQNRY